MSAVANGDDDQMILTRGNVRVSSTSLAWTLWTAATDSGNVFDFCLGANLPLGLAYDLMSATDLIDGQMKVDALEGEYEGIPPARKTCFLPIRSAEQGICSVPTSFRTGYIWAV